MRRTTLFSISAVFVLAILFGGSVCPPPSNDLCQSPTTPFLYDNNHRMSPVAVCFDEGTDPEYMAEVRRRLALDYPLDYNIGSRWSVTATDGATGDYGDGVTLTYSFIPDGVNISGQPSILWSALTEEFGSEEAWQAQFDSAFAFWGRLSGNTYIRVADDGANFGFFNPGELGVRGDVRIGAINYDGPSNVLAYNYYPDNGDMVLDASEEWGNAQSMFRFFINIVTHEHGHGLGIAHVCPNDGTKLMEPIYSSAHHGPQHDDIRAVQRLYGDPYEPNDQPPDAYELGTVAEYLYHQHCSLDDNSDTDYYRLTAPGSMAMSIDLIPVGKTYLEGQEIDDGCEPGVEINTIDDNNLNLYLMDASGANALASSNNQPAGRAESIFRYLVPASDTEYTILINGATANEIQLYDLEISMVDPATPILSGCPLAFGDVELNVSATLPVTVHNPTVGQALTITSVTADTPFSVAPAAPITLQPGDNQVFNVSFVSSESGVFSGTLTIAHDGPGGDLVCEMTAKAVSVDIVFLTGNSLDFGEVEIQTTDSGRVAFRAVGNTTLTIESVAVIGEGFSIDYETPQTFVAGPLNSMYPLFSPTAQQVYQGSLIITHSGTTSPDTISLTGTGSTLSAGETVTPLEFALDQNYPNPFNPSTRISFTLPHNAHALLQIYDISGRLVKTLVDGELTLGAHSIEFDASAFAAGVYLYRLQAAEFSDVRKMMLLK